jgi:hypothetical protein
MAVTSRVNTKTTVGTVLMDPMPPWPRPTGGDGFPVEPMKPASTSPMKRMNSPMPAVMASLSGIGTASKTIRRRPVTASSTMINPSMTTKPIASDQLTEPTTVVARKELMPSPAAKANGIRAMTPKRIVMAPAASDVMAETWANSSLWPVTSGALDRMIGFSTMMYDIAMKVTTPTAKFGGHGRFPCRDFEEPVQAIHSSNPRRHGLRVTRTRRPCRWVGIRCRWLSCRRR